MDSGGKIRTGNILKRLARNHEITLISNVESPGDDAHLSQMKSFCSRFLPVPWRETPKHSLKFYLRLVLNLFSRYPVSVLNDHSKPLRQAVEREISMHHYDVAICDFVQSALNFKNVDGVPTILFQHNVESQIARRHFENSANILARLFWYGQWQKMRRFEERQCKRFNTVIAVSKNDKNLFQTEYGLKNVHTIPTGVDVDYFVPAPKTSTALSLVFCGSMDWLPNEDAMIFFVDAILPTIRARIPEVKLTIVGRNPSPALQRRMRRHPEITLTGWVQDIRPYIAQSSVYVVPLRIGGGTRMKIYEALAMGKAIVSTSVGAEGLSLRNEEHIIIADEPREFAESIIALLNDEAKRTRLEKTGAQYVRDNFAWEKVAHSFARICQSTAEINPKRNSLSALEKQ